MKEIILASPLFSLARLLPLDNIVVNPFVCPTFFSGEIWPQETKAVVSVAEQTRIFTRHILYLPGDEDRNRKNLEFPLDVC